MARKTERLNICMPPEMAARLRALAKQSDVPISVLVRRLLREALPQWEGQIKQNRMALLITRRTT